ncbi:hypothetical protein K7711_19925 [Nocardia sp. CA2R105]|uniref:hypothetical protein n=1 Tax=Nocardia coffeae TaxID=2873381 RepID=UPI001CA711BC|nr:hypothetical protein [Nocardia coffeae]MBY8858753.1 hypothetical protein [Nocardia coffeae]
MYRTPAPGSGGRTAAGPFRGVLVGATVATLAVAAHGLAGGGWPGSASLTLLLCTAAGIGAIATLLPVPAGTPSRTALLAALAAGQSAAHLALSLPGPDSMAAGRESCGAAGTFLAAVGLHNGPMAAAHALATLVCAILIIAAERLYTVVSRAIRTIIGPTRPLPPAPRATRWLDAPAHIHRLPHAGSLGSRAPPMPV